MSLGCTHRLRFEPASATGSKDYAIFACNIFARTKDAAIVSRSLRFLAEGAEGTISYCCNFSPLSSMQLAVIRGGGRGLGYDRVFCRQACCIKVFFFVCKAEIKSKVIRKQSLMRIIQ